MKFFSLERPAVKWGDYGDILLHGMTLRDEQSGLLKLERTGVFAPPISFPGLNNVVVTDSFRAALASSGLTGFSFRPVIKHHIVELQWEKWKSEEPDFYPESGEPEDYIYENNHSPDLAARMPGFWELVIAETAHVQRTEDPLAQYRVALSLIRESWNGDDFFRVPEVLYTFVSEKAKLWLEIQGDSFVEFRIW